MKCRALVKTKIVTRGDSSLCAKVINLCFRIVPSGWENVLGEGGGRERLEM